MVVVLVAAAFLLPIGWHVLVSDAVGPWWDRLKPYVGEFGVFLLYLGGYLGSIVAVIAAAQSIGVGGQAMVAFAFSFFGVVLYRWMNGEDIELG
jgi:hypothetical protein